MFKAFFYDAAGKPRQSCLAWQTCDKLPFLPSSHVLMPHFPMWFASS